MTPGRRSRLARTWALARQQHAEIAAAKADVDRQLAELRAELDAVRAEFAEQLLEAKREMKAAKLEFDKLRQLDRAIAAIQHHGFDAPTLQ